MYAGKFAFQNRLGWPYSWKEIYRFSLFYLVFEGNFQVPAPARGGLYLEGRFNGGFFALRVWGTYIWRGVLTEGFLRYEFGGLTFGGAF